MRNKKIFLMIFIINLIIFSLYKSYSYVVSKQIKENVINISTKTYDCSLDKDTITVSGNSKIDVTFTITNNDEFGLNYLLMHEKSVSKVLIYSSNGGSGYVVDNETVTVTIDNQNNEEQTIKFKLFTSTSNIDKPLNYSYINSDINYDHSNANKPNLNDIDGIPVYYDENEKVYKKADINNKETLWYDYDNFIWANIVLVTKESRSNYMKAELNTVINEEDILSYLVWVPKFRYVIQNYNNYTTYENMYNVIFESESNGTVVCNYSNYDDCYDKNTNKIYEGLSTYSHPAFTNSTGFWVSKFLVSENMYSLPFKEPSSETLEDALNYIRSMELSDNIYGFKKGGTLLNNDGSILNDKNNIDVKIMSNLEWGAITILYNSEYGKVNNSVYKDSNNTFTKIYPNLKYNMTGCSSNYTKDTNRFVTTESIECIKYNDNSNYTHNSNSLTYSVGYIGYGASTTGTIYGIYDLVGAMNEMTSSVTLNKNNTSPISLYSNYIDTYSYNEYIGTINSNSSIKNILRYKLGDGIRENYRNYSNYGLWDNGTLSQSVESGVIIRGGNYNSGKSLSIYTSDIVPVNNKLSYRVIISVK